MGTMRFMLADLAYRRHPLGHVCDPNIPLGLHMLTEPDGRYQHAATPEGCVPPVASAIAQVQIMPPLHAA